MVLQTRPLSVEEICNKLRPVFGKKIDEIYFRYTLADGREEREEIAHLLNALYQKNLSKLLDTGVLLEPPAEELMDGTYDISTVSYAEKKLYPFKLREKDWQRHICITGMSGSGKTTLAFRIIEELQRHNKAFLVFDWKKSFRPLIKTNSQLMVFTVGDEAVTNLFKTNINKPPRGVAPKEWISVIADMLTESFMASFGVHKILLETLDESFKEWGIYNGSNNFPTWNHIKWRLEEKLNKTEGREAGWLESALRIATVLTFGEFGKTLNYKGKSSISIEDLLDQQVVMELNSLGNVEKKFFCEFLLTYIYKLKKARQNDANSKFDHAIIVDEAHNIFLKKPTSFANESVTDMIYREMREYGTSLVCLDQHISKISDTVKGNSACTIAFQQQLPQDIEDISGLMQLREKKHFFSQLKVGNAIVKLSERYTQPFLVEVPYTDRTKITVTNEDIKGRMQAMILNHDFKEGEDIEFNEKLKNPKEPTRTFYIHRNERHTGVHEKIRGDVSKITGDVSKIYGDVTGLEGDVSNLVGNVTPITGNVNYISGDLNGLSGDVSILRGDVTNLTGNVQKMVEKMNEEKNSPKEKQFKESNEFKKASEEFATPIKEELVQENPKLVQEVVEPSKDYEIQDLLYTFVVEHLEKGVPLEEIEKILEQTKEQGRYTSQDIMEVINRVFENQLNIRESEKVKNDYSLENNNTKECYSGLGPQLEGLNPDQQVFIEFLQSNPDHMLSTVEVYRAVGLSARKGTKIKKELEDKGLIKIEEIKYDKGWKKIIRLNQ